MNLLTIAIRVDASQQIGTGHIVRCLTIAEALKVKSVRVIFICRVLLGDWILLLQERGFETISLYTKDELWNSDRDSDLTLKELNKKQIFPDWLIIDHYQIGQDWERHIRSAVAKIMVIDDLANRSHDCDLLLDQNLYPNYASRYSLLVPDHCHRLVGPHYLILRQEFCDSDRSQSRVILENPKKILLTFGGSDPFQLTERLLNSLKASIQDTDIEVRVLLGKSFSREDTLTELISSIPYPVTLISHATQIVEHVQWADCALSAGGLTSYELAYMRLPSLIFAVVPAQAEVAEEMEHLGIHHYAGYGPDLSESQIIQALEDFFHTFSMNHNLTQNIIDAQGVDRICSLLLSLKESTKTLEGQYQYSEKWDIWNQSGGPKYPNEKIVQFMFRSVPKDDRTHVKVLDLGCGSGVHTAFLATEGFETYACDISGVGVQNTNDRLRSQNLAATAWQSGLEYIPIQDGFLDFVISCNVFEAAGLEAVQQGFPEIIRVLKKGGKAFFLFASDRDFRIKGENVLNLYGFSDLEVEKIFKSQPVELLYIDRYITTFQNQTVQSNDFLVTIQK